MNKSNLTCINDGEIFDENKLGKFQINDLLRNTNGTITINFVGVVVAKEDILISFPKHFEHENLSDKEKREYAKSIASLLVKGNSTFFSPKTKNYYNEFPLNSYFIVLEYFKKYGIYNKKIKAENKSNLGRPNWNKTMRKSQKIIQDNGIIFLPIISITNKNSSVFLSDCMKFILSNTYEMYSDVLNFLMPYKDFPLGNIFKNFKACLRKLKLIRNYYFKDSEKELIQAMIRYFEWLSVRNSFLALTTTSFSSYWESMVHVFLNKSFAGFENDKLKFTDKPKYIFVKRSEQVEDDENRKNSQGFSIEFDHISISKEDNEIILFDSKYMNKINDLNYKQAFYYYFLKQKYPKAIIHNGLIAPTHRDTYERVHIDRTWIAGVTSDVGYSDGLKIMEYYLNLKKIIDFTLLNIIDFRKAMKSRSKPKV